MNCICLAQNMVQWQSLVNNVMNFCVPNKNVKTKMFISITVRFLEYMATCFDLLLVILRPVFYRK